MGLFRELHADEIECRVNTISEKTSKASLLLYKDARCDMRILDETVGPYNWKREHSRDNANCTVSIWDESKQQWLSKEDTGTESFTEKEKGLASDSFKRACVNWGIGRELYTAPEIWVDVSLTDGKNGKKTTYDKFKVFDIGYRDGCICDLVIVNAKSGAVVFDMNNDSRKTKNTPQNGSESLKQAKQRAWASVKKYAETKGMTTEGEAITLVEKFIASCGHEPSADEWDNLAKSPEFYLGA